MLKYGTNKAAHECIPRGAALFVTAYGEWNSVK